MIMLTSKLILKIAAVLSFLLALFQAVITISPQWSLYFGAGEYVVSRLWLLYLTGFIAAIIFAGFGLYVLSGLGYIRKMPLLRIGLTAITSVFILRGLVIIPELLIYNGVIISQETIYLRAIISSAVSLVIGLIYLSGIIGYWSNLSAKR